MDAVEYEKGRRRMCRTNILKKGGCEGCNAYSILRRRCGFAVDVVKSESEDADVIKKNIAIVEQWAKDNPVKTRQSEFLKLFPNAPKSGRVLDICPQNLNIDYMPPKRCENISCCACKTDYWNEEVTDNEN